MSIFHKDDKEAFENYRLCHKCKGKCCKNSPCLLDKSDIDSNDPMDIARTVILKDFSINMLTSAKGYKVMDYFDFPYLYVSSGSVFSKEVNALNIPNVCKNLTPKGCKFNSKERPLGGRLLVPKKDFTCSYENEEEVYKLILSWKELQDELRQAVILITGSTVDELAKSQYEAIVTSEDGFLGDPILSKPAQDFKYSYHYCELVKKYGFKFSYEVMNYLDAASKRLDATQKEELFKELSLVDSYLDEEANIVITRKFTGGIYGKR